MSGAEGVAQWQTTPPSMHEALGLILSIAKCKK